jgi:hypothetical protein
LSPGGKGGKGGKGGVEGGGGGRGEAPTVNYQINAVENFANNMYVGEVPRSFSQNPFQQQQWWTEIFCVEYFLQLIAVPKARIGNLLFWDVFKEFPVSQ